MAEIVREGVDPSPVQHVGHAHPHGCAAFWLAGGAAAGAGAVAYAHGRLRSDEAHDLETVARVAAEVLAAENHKILSSESANTRRKYLTNSPKGTEVTVTLTEESEGVTRVDIRVGFWGDERESRRLLEKIRGALPRPRSKR